MKAIIDDFIAPPCYEDIGILYEDASILLINKPSGLLSLSGKNPRNQDSVHYRLKQDYPTATLVHRLDFGTSGIMLVALNKTVNAHLTKQFQARTVRKKYIAFLDGKLSLAEGVIDFPVAKDKHNFPMQKICFEEGKPAQSYFRVLAYLDNPERTKVEFVPESGRTHQLRIHSREIGHSILGCDLYATHDVTNKAERLMLHAYELEFEHPVTAERIVGVSKLEPFSYNEPC